MSEIQGENNNKKNIVSNYEKGIVFFITYVIKNIVTESIGFKYNLFDDKFYITKILMDFTLWVMIYLLIYYIYKTLKSLKSK